MIKIIRFTIGRYMVWQDPLADLAGGLLEFLVVQLSMPVYRRFMNNPVIVLLFVIVLLIAFYPVYKIVSDDLNIEVVFPVIASFES